MSWSYIDPSLYPRDQVRFLCGDTDPADPLISDEEIAWLLTLTGNEVYDAAARCADHLYAFYARQTDKTVGSLRVAFSQKVEHFRQLSRQLRLGDVSLVAPYGGGYLQAEQDALLTSGVTVPPYFRAGVHDVRVVNPLLWFGA